MATYITIQVDELGQAEVTTTSSANPIQVTTTYEPILSTETIQSIWDVSVNAEKNIFVDANDTEILTFIDQPLGVQAMLDTYSTKGVALVGIERDVMIAYVTLLEQKGILATRDWQFMPSLSGVNALIDFIGGKVLVNVGSSLDVEGVTTSATNQYIKSSWNPTTHGVKFKSKDAYIMQYGNTANFGIIVGAQNATQFNRFTSNWAINGSGASVDKAVDVADSLIHINRKGAKSTTLRYGGEIYTSAAVDHSTVPTEMIDLEFYLGGINYLDGTFSSGKAGRTFNTVAMGGDKGYSGVQAEWDNYATRRALSDLGVTGITTPPIPQNYSTLDKTDAYVIVIAGQSNSNGAGNTPPSAELAGIQDNVYIINENTHEEFENLEHKSNDVDSLISQGANGVGHQMKLGSLIVNGLSKPLYIINTAQAASFVAASGANWSPSGTLLPKIKSNWDASQAYFAANNINTQFLGIAWTQGEADATALSTADAYDVNCKVSIDAMLTHFGESLTTTKVIQARLATWNSATYASTVRAKQELLATNNTNWVFANTDDLASIGDNIHYDTASQEILAQRIYALL